MARNSLFNESELSQLKLAPPTWKSNAGSPFLTLERTQIRDFSSELQQKLEARLNQNPLWLKSRPVRLGSWGRGELTPQSDLDVLFLAGEEIVGPLVQSLQESGIRVRARVPENPKNLFAGVEPFDWLSLLDGKAVQSSDQAILEEHRQRLQSSAALKRKLLSEIKKDRKRRSATYDSLRNRLEPHLKHSPGGLRDLVLSRHLVEIFPEIRAEEITQHAVAVIEDALQLFLQLRTELHLSQLQDQLVSTAQLDLSQKYGFPRLRDLMKEVNRRLDRGSFYSSWIIDWLSTSEKIRKKQKKFKKPAELLQHLKKDPSRLAQAQVRTQMDRVFKKAPAEKTRGQMLWQTIAYDANPEIIRAVFESRLIDKICPHVRTLIGLVQHDQYHRWTADAHVMKACLEVQNAYRQPKLLLNLQKLAKTLKKTDWQILTWTAFYHDIAKGKDGDHSQVGAQILESELRAFGVAPTIRQEVRFLVENHLVLSELAFRKNPRDPKVWREILNLGFNPDRVRRLAVFTALDIRATNEEAWNSWKSELLQKALSTLLEPEKYEFQKTETRLKKKIGEKFFSSLDPDLFRAFSGSTLEKDWLGLANSKIDSDITVLQDRKGRKWVRFYDRKDKLGLFEGYVSKLFYSGVSVEQALVQNIADFGVYDLFQVPKRSWPQLKRLLASRTAISSASAMKQSEPPTVKLSKIEIMFENDQEAVLSFKGPDARGILWRIASELQKHGLFILRASIHTWGQQIEDVIHVKPHPELPNILEKMRIDLLR